MNLLLKKISHPFGTGGCGWQIVDGHSSLKREKELNKGSLKVTRNLILLCRYIYSGSGLLGIQFCIILRLFVLYGSKTVHLRRTGGRISDFWGAASFGESPRSCNPWSARHHTLWHNNSVSLGLTNQRPELWFQNVTMKTWPVQIKSPRPSGLGHSLTHVGLTFKRSERTPLIFILCKFLYF